MSTHKYEYLMLTNSLIDDVDSTKRLKLSLTNISPNTTRTLVVPDANTTIVGTDTTAILTNKTIQGTTNIVDANNLKTTGAAVGVAASAPPTTNQVLTATSATAATWQAPTADNLRTATTIVNVSASAAPTINQVLTATSATTATWQTPSPFSVFLNNAGAVSNPSISTLK